MGKYILPWFGGGPGVWTVCLLFFQVMLLGGYLYAHIITHRLTLNKQRLLHAGLILLSLLLLPIHPKGVAWQPGSGHPTMLILGMLFFTIGLPYVLLASTAPLLQRWFAHTLPGRSPYRLYALSNTGSLLALLSFPILVEPNLGRGWQVMIWSSTYGVFALLCMCVAWTTKAPHSGERIVTDNVQDDTSTFGKRTCHVGWWLALSACGSVLLMATTNQLCMEVAVVPFLWIYPLTLYLLSFIVCFDHSRWYTRKIYGPCLFLAASTGYLAAFGGAGLVFWKQILGYGFWLFVGCMVCHGELVRAKPEPARLTAFYLAVAAGGALGGLFVAMVAPVLFLGFWEYQLSILICCVLALWLWKRDWSEYEIPRWIKRTVCMWLAMVLLGMGIYLFHYLNNVIDVGRNFYGVLRVVERDSEAGPLRSILHGRINHGCQLLDEHKRLWPTSYFGPNSGVGLALRYHPARIGSHDELTGLNIAVVGLGAGSIAAHGQPGDRIRFYEINPMVESMAWEHFSFLQDSAAKVDVVLGDARMTLEAELVEERGRYDILILDAFSSDSIPIHLLTSECIELYQQHVTRDGLLVFHVSNHLIDLIPVAQAVSEQLGWHPTLFYNKSDFENTGVLASTWVVFSASKKFSELDDVEPFVGRWPEVESIPWSDDFASLWPLLRWK